MRLLFVCLLALSLQFCASTVKLGKDKDLILWNEGSSLEWKDFKAKPVLNSPHLAETTTRIDYKILSKESIEVNCFFLKEKSWVKDQHRVAELLEHEQYHFHIAELNTRKMRRDMAEIQYPSTKNVQEVYDKWNQRQKKEQALYDAETDHSKNIAEQAKWQKKIDQELTELSNFKNSIVYLNAK